MNIANERIKFTADFLMKIGVVMILASVVMLALGVVVSVYAVVGLFVGGLLAIGAAFLVLGRLRAEDS